LITIHNAENWLGLDEEGGGVGGPCDSILLPRPPALSPVLKSGTDVVASAAASLKSSKFGRSDTPGVNCINILCAAFARAKTVKLSVFLSFRDLRAQKLRMNMLVCVFTILKLVATTYLNFLTHLTRAFSILNRQITNQKQGYF
jgi:hypothetical protein